MQVAHLPWTQMLQRRFDNRSIKPRAGAAYPLLTSGGIQNHPVALCRLPTVIPYELHHIRIPSGGRGHLLYQPLAYGHAGFLKCVLKRPGHVSHINGRNMHGQRPSQEGKRLPV